MLAGIFNIYIKINTFNINIKDLVKSQTQLAQGMDFWRKWRSPYILNQTGLFMVVHMV